MNDEIKIPTMKITPLKKICMTIGEIPTSYLETMTYYEMLIWFTNYLRDSIIPAVNNNAEAVHELQELFEELQTYVNDYFDNLDVQEEINNKLDDMVEAGTLQEIIAEYLNSKAIFGFDNVNSMINATNLIDGSYARTLGKININDNKGGLYKIREITNDDVVDGVNIIAMETSNTLIAQLIKDENILNLQNDVTNLNEDNLDNMVVVGDSYTALSLSNWAESVAQELHLTLYKHATSSMGYVHAIQDKTFIDNLTWGMAESLRLKTKYLICYGGLNDLNETPSSVTTAVNDFCTQAKTLFPNARIIIVGPQSDIPSSNSKKLFDIVNAIHEGAVNSGVGYADAHTWLYDTPFGYAYTYANDNTHPNATGYKIIASKMLSLINGENSDKTSILVEAFTGLENVTTIRTNQNGNSTHINARITSVTMGNGTYTPLLKFNTKNLGFCDTNSPLMIVEYNTTYGFYGKILGFGTITTDGRLLGVNNSGAVFTGAVEVIGDVQLTYNRQL